jgi:hypothetical protein
MKRLMINFTDGLEAMIKVAMKYGGLVKVVLIPKYWDFT